MRLLRRALVVLVVLGTGLGAVAVSRGDGETHYALDPLRDCLALRGSLVTLLPGGASEGTLAISVKGDNAVLEFARDGRRAAARARAHAGAVRHGNLVTYARRGRLGKQARATVERCLSDGHGRPGRPPIGYRYPAAALATFDGACNRVSATQAQCNCVLTGAQATMPFADFQRVAAAEATADDDLMTALLDGCQLVG